MGQYYAPIIDAGEGVIAFTCQVTGEEYAFAKLMEHAWWNNPTVAAVMYQIAAYGKAKVAWVGDYAEEPKIPGMDISPQVVWGGARQDLPPQFFYPDGLYLVNHTSRTYLDFDHYRKKIEAHENYKDGDWVIHPLPLLTAIGNGLGGGDFNGGIGEEDVGSWCGNLLSVEGIPPADYEEEDIVFIEKGVTYIS